MPLIALPPAPVKLVAEGAPRFGLWSGPVADATLSALAAPFARSAFARLLVEKQWVYTLVSTPELFLCIAIIDAGIVHSCFLGLFDRKSRTLLADTSVVLPGLGLVKIGEQPTSLSARIWGPNVQATIVRNGDGATVHADIKGTEVALRLDGRAEPASLSACADLGAGRFNFTQKRVGLVAEGTIRHAGRTMAVERGYAGLDFTHGYLRRKTDWRWAFGMGSVSGRQVAFNFSDGFLGSAPSENTVWLDGVAHATGAITFQFDVSNSSTPWLIRSDDGTVDLEFIPEGQRAQKVWTPLMASAYVQPFGSFRGRIRTPRGEVIALDEIAGVTEDHSATW